jgi:ribose/xylose/arabinose/galactoside ABC-type transport system permease subunit
MSQLLSRLLRTGRNLMSDETIMSAGASTAPAERPPRFALNMRWRLASEAIWFVLALLLASIIFALNSLFLNVDLVLKAGFFQRVLPFALVLPPTVLILASGGLDLSIEGVAALAVIIIGQTAERGALSPVGVVAALVMALVVGLFNGLLVGLVRINGALVTLGSGVALQMLAIARYEFALEVPGATEIFGEGVGRIVLWAIALLAIGVTALLLYLTPLGRRPRPGDDRQESGLARLFFVGSPYVFSSLLSVLATLANLGSLGIGSPNSATSLQIGVLLAALIAGTPFGLGYGYVIAGISGLMVVLALEYSISYSQARLGLEMWYLRGLGVLLGSVLAHLYAYGARAIYARRGGQVEPAVPDEE